MAKLGVALTAARTGEADSASPRSDPASSEAGKSNKAAGQSVRPLAFKSVVGKGHSEFSSGRQQVALGSTPFYCRDVLVKI